MSDKSTEKKEDKKLAKDTKKVKDDKKGSTKSKKASAKSSDKKSFNNPFKSVKKLYTEQMSEIKKISWPAPQETTKNALITLGAIIVVGLFIWALDFGLSKAREVAFNKIPEWSIFNKADTTSDSDLIVTQSDSAE